MSKEIKPEPTPAEQVDEQKKEQEKLNACNKEVSEVLEKHGYNFQIAHVIQLVKKS